jgi:hypothetical protein
MEEGSTGFLLTLIALLAQLREAAACTWISDFGGELEDLPGHNVCLPKVVIYESARGSEESLSGRFASPKSHDRDSLWPFLDSFFRHLGR